MRTQPRVGDPARAGEPLDVPAGQPGAGLVGALVEAQHAGAGIAQGAGVALFAPPDLLGSAFGALATIQSFANLAASAVAGALWTLVSPRAAFLYLAGWAAVSVVALAAVRR